MPQDKINLDIVTPDHLVVSVSVDEVQIPGKEGYLGVLPGHAPLLTELMIGEISYRHGAHTAYLAVSWGYAEVLPDRVTILAETAETAENIDVQRALAAKDRAEKRLAKVSDPEIDFDRARVALQRALSRLQAAKHAGISV